MSKHYEDLEEIGFCPKCKKPGKKIVTLWDVNVREYFNVCKKHKLYWGVASFDRDKPVTALSAKEIKHNAKVYRLLAKCKLVTSVPCQCSVCEEARRTYEEAEREAQLVGKLTCWMQGALNQAMAFSPEITPDIVRQAMLHVV